MPDTLPRLYAHPFSSYSQKALVALYGAVPHSDFHPVVALDAPRSRFVGASVQSITNLTRAGMPVRTASVLSAPGWKAQIHLPPPPDDASRLACPLEYLFRYGTRS